MLGAFFEYNFFVFLIVLFCFDIVMLANKNCREKIKIIKYKNVYFFNLTKKRENM